MTTRRQFLTLLLGTPALAAAGCQGDKPFTLLGYRFGSNYDRSIKSVYVPVFKNATFQTTPYRNFEVQLTRMVVNQIEATTPYKVISDPERADTELLGTVTQLSKLIWNRNQQNEVREAELLIALDLVWRDMATGKVYTNGRGTNDQKLQPQVFDPSNPPLGPAPDAARPVRLRVTGRMIPELGESNVSMLDMAMKRMAVLVAQLMEEPWQLPQCDATPVVSPD